jgi:hypothetical protein
MNKITIVLVLMIFGGGAASAWQLRRINAVENEIAQLSRGKSEHSTPAATRPAEEAEKGSEKPAPPDAAAAEEAKKKAESRKLARDQHSRLVAGLEITDAYGALQPKLNVSVEQWERLKSLLAEKRFQLARFHRETAAREYSDRASERMKLVAAMRDPEHGVRRLLDERDYQTYQRYEILRPTRALLEELATALSYTSTPLTEQQANRVIELRSAALEQVSAEGREVAIAGGRDPEGLPSILSVATDAAVFSAAQLEVLRNLCEAEKNNRTLLKLAASIRLKQ